MRAVSDQINSNEHEIVEKSAKRLNPCCKMENIWRVVDFFGILTSRGFYFPVDKPLSPFVSVTSLLSTPPFKKSWKCAQKCNSGWGKKISPMRSEFLRVFLTFWVCMCAWSQCACISASCCDTNFFFGSLLVLRNKIKKHTERELSDLLDFTVAAAASLWIL